MFCYEEKLSESLERVEHETSTHGSGALKCRSHILFLMEFKATCYLWRNFVPMWMRRGYSMCCAQKAVYNHLACALLPPPYSVSKSQSNHHESAVKSQATIASSSHRRFEIAPKIPIYSSPLPLQVILFQRGGGSVPSGPLP